MKSSYKKVEIFQRLNKLKIKAGADAGDNRAGFIDPRAIKAAQTAIDNKESDYTKELEGVLVKLDSSWSDTVKEKNEKERQTHIKKVYNYANNIKDLADTYSYKLMDYFSQSLRDFCEKVDPTRDEHKIIVQAHIDVMWVVYHESIKDDGGPKAEELKLIVKKAIEKYS